MLQPRRTRQPPRCGLPRRQHRSQHTGVQQQRRRHGTSRRRISSHRQPAACALVDLHWELPFGQLRRNAAARHCGPRPPALPGAAAPALAGCAGTARPGCVRHPSSPPGKLRCAVLESKAVAACRWCRLSLVAASASLPPLVSSWANLDIHCSLPLPARLTPASLLTLAHTAGPEKGSGGAHGGS